VYALYNPRHHVNSVHTTHTRKHSAISYRSPGRVKRTSHLHVHELRRLKDGIFHPAYPGSLLLLLVLVAQMFQQLLGYMRGGRRRYTSQARTITSTIKPRPGYTVGVLRMPLSDTFSADLQPLTTTFTRS
jgi:hypothetical protein